MNSLQPSIFFDLEHYEHRSLFQEAVCVWEALAQMSSYFEKYPFQKLATAYPGVTFVNPAQIYIGEQTTIEHGAYIEGPCIIGKGCRIRHGAYLRQNIITGNNCVIGHCTELKNAILLDNVHIAHLAYGGDSIFGNHCNIGAGVKCANLKLNNSLIVIRSGGTQYATNLRKLGVIVGDGTQLGCNSVTNPGTLIGKNCQLYPCTNFGGVAPEESVIRLDTRAIMISKTKKKT